MRLDEEYDEYGKNKIITTAVGIGIAMIVVVVGFVLIANSDKFRTKTTASESTSSIVLSVSFSDNKPEISIDSSSSLAPSDLDFYELYPVGETNDNSVSSSLSVSSKDETVETDPAKDGKHTLLQYDDGTEEWVEISEYIKKNNYDYLKLQNQDGIMEYVDNAKVVSRFGVDISKEQDYVDFNKLRKAGVDFVMIRVGARGYSSGTLTIDDYFKDNIKRATDAGLEIGVYFLSQAITEEEAEEEADIVLENIKHYELNYPVAYVMEYPENDNCRVEVLTRSEKTMIARAFLNKIDESGYKTAIYGSKVWLIKYLELSKIVSDYDVWLSEPGDMPSYPYRFTMWQYNKSGTISGIKGPVGFNISMVDYTLR